MKPQKGSRAFTSSIKINPSRPPRAERVAKQLREEIAQLMVREMKDPRVRLASISDVQLSRDLKNARVMVSAIGEEKERREVVTALRHAEGYLRAELGGRLENLKVVPRLRFELDESIAYSVHISSMLRELQPAEEPPAEEPPAESREPGEPGVSTEPTDPDTETPS